MIETADELAAFFNPAEFGVAAVITMPGLVLSTSGIFDSMAKDERVGETTNTSNSPWLVGAADITVQTTMITVPYVPDLENCTDCPLVISTGKHAGTYRIKNISRDTDIARLLLNKSA